MPPKSVWIQRSCPKCGAQPGADCVSETGQRARQPHTARVPEAPTDYQRKLRAKAQRELQAERARRSDRRLMPLDMALRDIERERMARFRNAA